VLLYLLIKIVDIVDWALGIYIWIVIVRALLTWVSPDPFNPIVRTINRLVDPVSYRISRIIPTRIGMVDISPLILILLIQAVRMGLRVLLGQVF
jgi:YggT family protein